MAQQSSVLPELNLSPKLPKNPDDFPIIMIGAGAIVNLAHLPAYKLAGFTIKGIYEPLIHSSLLMIQCYLRISMQIIIIDGV